MKNIAANIARSAPWVYPRLFWGAIFRPLRERTLPLLKWTATNRLESSAPLESCESSPVAVEWLVK